jgi:NADH/NAD ratio-sensing transcriptional regulator Rex
MQSMGTSLDAQESYLLEYAKRNKYDVKDTIREIGSVWQGRKSSKILNKFVDTIRNNKKTTFLLLDVSRLCRWKNYGTKILDLLDENSNKIIFVSQELRIPKMRKRFEQQLAYAQMESERLSRRVKISKQYLKKRGFCYGGKAKYGNKHVYDAKEGRKVMKKNRRERRIIKFIVMCKQDVIFRSRLNLSIAKITNTKRRIECFDADGKKIKKLTESLTYQEISDLLNDFNIRYRTGKWTKFKVSRVYRQSKHST